MERMIYNLTGIKTTKTQQKEKSSINPIKLGKNGKQINYICLQCNKNEMIPLNVVRSFDEMDDGEPTVPPQFSCETCGGLMYPEYYKGLQGYVYKISDVQE